VERFTDRLRGGELRPYTPDVLGDPVEYENAVREQVSEEFILGQAKELARSPTADDRTTTTKPNARRPADQRLTR
jgi:hypothetical protein